jgi:hypothetical protein
MPTNYYPYATGYLSARIGLPSCIKRHKEHRTRWVRNYDHQRAKCEDLRLIKSWFMLVRNIQAKYGILEDDIYNFDETGFMMGIIFAGMVVTTSEGRTKAKLAQPGNREWGTVIQGVNARGWAIPPFIILATKCQCKKSQFRSTLGWFTDILLWFRWAFWQLDSLARCCHESAMEKALAPTVKSR